MPTVQIACFVDSFEPSWSATSVIAVDVIRSMTTAVSVLERGGRCLLARDLEAVSAIGRSVSDALLVGELGGNKPFGFDFTNSPVDMERAVRPKMSVVLLSSSGTRLVVDAAARYSTVYGSCLRNWTAQARAAEAAGEDVLLLGAGTRGEFREEDQLCCAWIGAFLLAAGFSATDDLTRRVVDRWGSESVFSIIGGNSAKYLRATRQDHDLQFILSHVDDIDSVLLARSTPGAVELVVSDAPVAGSGGG